MADAGSGGLRPLARDVVRSARGHDLLLYAAGTTAYAAVGLVPLLLLAVRLLATALGEQQLVRDAEVLVAHVPEAFGARDAVAFVVDAGAGLSWPQALACLVPATLYGEGLVRSLDRLSAQGERGRRVLRGRAVALVLLGLGPTALLAALGAARGVDAALGEGPWAAALGVYLAFLSGWLIASVLLLGVFGALPASRPGTRALLWGATGTASVLTGFALGWVLFLRWDLPVAEAYAGSAELGALAASVLWLLVLHAIALLGYVTTLQLDARGGHPRGRVVRNDEVRGAGVER